MSRFIPISLALAGFVLAAPAFAADPVAPYQSIAPLAIKADAGQQNTAQSDPLTDVTQMDLALKFTCAAANCDQSAFQLLLEGDGNDTAQVGFTAQEGLLKGAVWRHRRVNRSICASTGPPAIASALICTARMPRGAKSWKAMRCNCPSASITCSCGYRAANWCC